MDAREPEDRIAHRPSLLQYSQHIADRQVHHQEETRDGSRDDSRIAFRNVARIDSSLPSIDHELAARNAAYRAVQDEAASKFARAIAIEEHNRRMRQARVDAAAADARLTAALEEVRQLEEEMAREAQEEQRQAISDQTPATTLDIKSAPPVAPSYAAQGLIYLGSDSSSDESDDSDDES